MKTFKPKPASCLFISMLFLFGFFTANAQTKEKVLNKIYLQSGAGGGAKSMAFTDLGMQAIFKNKWSTTLSYQSISMSPKNLPSDYIAESGYFLFIPYENEITANMNLVSLTAGRYFKTGRKSWATIEGGLSYVSGEKVSFQRSEVYYTNIIIAESSSSNYNTTTEKKTSVGGTFKADINGAFSSFMGVGFGVFANFNSIQSQVGFQVKLILGNMGREKKKKN